MPAPNLRQVRTFKDLIRYLEEELHWPLDGYEMEDLTFDYEPADLGLKDEDAAKVKTIRQLRPLASDQPWGIFFIDFDKKKLPVVLLRRILSHLVVKKRASANKADRAAWNAEDLLFVSAFGPEDQDGREIGFAHFHQESGDLPSLRVLGWDGADTSMKLNTVAATLRERLSWPEKGEKLDAWQQRWAGAFKHRIGHIIRTSDMLAEAMAALAKRIRDAATTIIQHETEKGPLTKLHRAFQTNLIHDLTAEGFADTYAQTITYGLFTAALSKTDMTGGRHGTALIASNIIDMVPVTNPFLKEMLSTFLNIGGRKGGIDFDELGIQDVVELLRGEETDLPAIRDDFGNRTRGEDPVIHFYEHFLTAYNKKLKIQRGVFYTPQPVVSYIVRSVHELLQTEFGLEDGLADTTTWGEMLKKHLGLKLPPLTDEPGETRTISPDEMFVQILDPATGTATFLVEVIDVIFLHLKAKWAKGGLVAMPALPTKNQEQGTKNFSDYWNLYVPAALLPRLHAYELMMAPYAIAHMKIGLKLAETGYKFATEERARIYLTNALEPWVKQLPLIGFDALAHEAAAVNEIKRHKRFTVVIGNPPYSNFGQLNKNPFILSLLEDYKRGLNEKKLNLDDDFIKFVRFSQHLLDRSGVGVLGYITNNVYADGVTHRRMRESLMETFHAIRLLDLHGSSKRQEQAPGGAKDENVFDITIGVGVGLFTRSLSGGESRSVVHSELWGERPAKYASLLNASVPRTHWARLSATAPHFFFVPKDFDQLAEYQRCIPVQEMFPLSSSGIQTKRDNVAIAETKETLLTTLKDFSRLSATELRSRYDLPDDGRDWRIEWASAHAKEILKSPETVAPILYRPFDSRWTVMDSRSKGVVAYPRFSVMSQMVCKNLALIVTRQLSLPTFQHVFATRQLIDGNTISLQTREYNYIFPLYLRDEQANQRSLSFDSHGKTNLGTAFLKTLASQLKVQIGSNGMPVGLTPEDIFHYIYAVFHSPGYRSRYAEFLKIDFPRLPLTGNLALFRELSRLGGELTALHLLESPKLEKPITEFIGTSKEVTKVGYSDHTVWINASGTKGNTTAGTSGFRGVPEAVWNFHIGGYQVCEKWLKDRKGRSLTDEDITHYHKIVIALTETIRLMAEIDQVIDSHGGWPGAFQTAQA
jgi:hypothetical protein